MSNPNISPIWPRPLSPGRTIGLVAPAGASPLADIEAGIHALEARAYHVVTSANAQAQGLPQTPYLAADDDARAADLNAFFRDPDIDAILCTRGGYGAMRLLDKLDYQAFAADPKPVIGYSDITSLSLALYAKTGVVGFSGIMAADGHGFKNPQMDAFNEESFFAAIGGGAFPRVLSSPPHEPGWTVHRAASHTVSGRLFPVCLTLLAHLIGTPYFPDLSGAILVIEDVEEPLYAVDRYLTHLRLAGHLENLAAVLIGSFTGVSDAEQAKLAAQIPKFVLEMTPPSVAVVSGIAYGHIPRRLTLPVGANCTVDFAVRTFTFPA